MAIETIIPWCDSTLSHDENRFWMSGRETGNQTGQNIFASIRQFERRLEEALTWPNLYMSRRERKPWLDKSRRLVLVDELGDPFSEGLPPDWLAPYLERMSRAPHTSGCS